jgi:hypothetical protein
MTRPLHEGTVPQGLREDLLAIMKRHRSIEPTVLLAAFAHATGSLYQLTPPSEGTEEELMDLIMKNLSLGQQAVIAHQRAKRRRT